MKISASKTCHDNSVVGTKTFALKMFVILSSTWHGMPRVWLVGIFQYAVIVDSGHRADELAILYI